MRAWYILTLSCCDNICSRPVLAVLVFSVTSSSSSSSPPIRWGTHSTFSSLSSPALISFSSSSLFLTMAWLEVLFKYYIIIILRGYHSQRVDYVDTGDVVGWVIPVNVKIKMARWNCWCKKEKLLIADVILDFSILFSREGGTRFLPSSAKPQLSSTPNLAEQ